MVRDLLGYMYVLCISRDQKVTGIDNSELLVHLSVLKPRPLPKNVS